MPNDFAQTPEGLILVADGWDQAVRWDGFASQAEIAGVTKPTVAPTVTSAGRGQILGTYRAYLRFVDAYDNVSDLSPVSADRAASSSGGDVAGANSSTPITLTILSHGLTAGALINVAGVQGQAGANGTWFVAIPDSNHVILVGSSSSGTYTTGGTWTSGVGSIRYSGVQAAIDPQVVRRQILRNTDGEANTYYVDIDTTDLSSGSFISLLDDSTLAAQEPVAVIDAAGNDLANVHARPPATKCYLAHQQGRMFYAGEVEYGEGAAKVTYGSTTVSGIGTEWSSQIPGRFLYVIGANAPYQVLSVNVDAQTLVLVSPYLGNTDPYASYSLRPPPAEGRTVYYSEPGLCESVPATNGLTLPDDNDQQTGIMSLGSFLYIIERKHLYRLTFQDDPVSDGALFLAANRGCVNQRCWVIVEGVAYMLDELGIHTFDAGRDKGSISTPLQTLFRPDEDLRINWSSSRFFHAVHDPAIETIRWFVSLSGQHLPRHAICYHYTLDRWWLEEYPFAIGSSALGKVARQSAAGTWGVGREQVFLGATGRRVLAFDAGPLDGPDPNSGHLNDLVISAGRTSLTGGHAMPPGVVGFPVAITAGRGKGQWRIITAVSGDRMQVRRPWLVMPDDTSEFQIGAIPWAYKTGWFRWVDSEDDNSRRIEVMFEPNETGQMTIRRYRDRATDPVQAAVTRSDDGVSTVAGSGDIEVDLNRPSGFVQARLDGAKEQYAHGPRLISIELAGFGGNQAVRIDQITIDGVKS